MRKANITARPTKCLIATDNIDFLGHQVGHDAIGLHQDNSIKIEEIARPQTKKEVRSFIGLLGYYRDYMPNFASIAAPLTDLTRKGQPNRVRWETAQEKAYVTLKSLLMKKPILHLPDPTKTFILRTDASDLGVGAILLQEFGGKLFPISFASKKLSDRERKFSTIEKECLAIVWGVTKFRLYLDGPEFILQTDHQPLVYLRKSKFINDRVMRWAMFLQSFNFKIQSIKGSDNVGADYLSRVV